MFCPKCSNKKTKVLDTRNNSVFRSYPYTVRKRKCPSCGIIFYTCETPIEYNDGLDLTSEANRGRKREKVDI